jgi:hypothetical protein
MNRPWNYSRGGVIVPKPSNENQDAVGTRTQQIRANAVQTALSLSPGGTDAEWIVKQAVIIAAYIRDGVVPSPPPEPPT